MIHIRENDISDCDLQALVDGEFDMATHACMIENVKKNPVLLNRLEELFDQKFMLKEWWHSLPAA